MKVGGLARAAGLCGIVVLGAMLMMASNNTNPPSATPTMPIVKVEGGKGSVTVPPHVPFQYAALPLKSMQNGVQILFNAPSPTTLKVVLTDPSTTPTTSVQLPVITAAQSPPASTSTTGFARTDGFDTTQTPTQWTVTVRPPDSFYALTFFTVSISVISLDPAATGANHESPPLILTLQSFRISVAIAGGNAAVTSTPGGIACGRGGDCTHDFTPAGPLAIVQLNPSAHSTDGLTCFSFLGWSGDCSGTNSCTAILTGSNKVNVAATFDAGQSCNPSPANCSVPGQATPLCPATAANSSGIALCDSTGWYCCSSASPTKAGSNCPSGTGPAYGAVICTQGSPSAQGCQ